jgi:hypothetical protein
MNTDMNDMVEDDTKGGKRSAWMSHVKKTMRAHKGMKLGAVLKMASKTFKKSRRGGALSPSPLGGEGGGAPTGAAPVGGRRRRGSRKSRGTRKSRRGGGSDMYA